MAPGFQEWAESVSLWQIIMWAGIGVTVVLFFWKGWPWLRRSATAVVNFATIVDSVQDLPKFIKRTDDTLEQQNKQIADIHHEVHYNNGSSVKDGVQRVETGLAGLHVEVATIASELAQAKETLSLSDGRIRLDLEERRAVEDTRNEEE
jgi:VanZ family protein